MMRGIAAVMIGVPLLVLCAVMTIVTALGSCCFFGLQGVVMHAPYWSGLLFRFFVYSLLRVEVRIDGEIKHTDCPTIVLGNHPSLPLMMLYVGYLEEILGSPIVVVGKRELLWQSPFVGWPLLLARIGILINRDDRRGAVEKIRSLMHQVFARHAALVIFPDQSRPTEQRIQWDWKKFDSRIPDVQQFTETTVPREGGIGALLDAAPDDARVILVEFMCNERIISLRDLLRLNRPIVAFRVEDVTGKIPQGSDARRKWLVEHWRALNEQMREFRRTEKR